MYDISGFADWLNESKDGSLVPFEKLGLKENAPPEAIEAYKEFCEVQEWADENNIQI